MGISGIFMQEGDIGELTGKKWVKLDRSSNGSDSFFY
jgi:hypothetical protein